MEFGPIVRALGRNRMRVVLIVVQIAMTLAVVSNAVSMINTERKAMQTPSGFDDVNLLRVQSRQFGAKFDDRDFRIITTEADLRALRSMPGVVAVSNSRFLPWQGGGSSSELKVAGGDGSLFRTQVYNATPGIVQTLGNHVVSGRDFRDSDVNDDPNAKTQTVLITRELEKLVFNGQSAVGRQLLEDDDSLDNIVGVVDPFYNPYGWPIHTYAVFYAGHTSRGSSFYLVRTEPGAMKRVAPLVEKRLLAVNDGRNITTQLISEVRDNYFGQARIIIGSMLAVIILIVLVTALGIAGVTSFTVTERRKQIGTRRALGATKPAILRYFLLENWIITNAGLVLGIVLAYAFNYLLVTQTSATKLDWRLVAAGVVLLWIQGIAATLAPAMRAAAVSPVIATKAA
jgi:putative ABC transport system permease protein